MQPLLFDSSIYISALRTGKDAGLTLRQLAADAPVWLSSVVLEELYAGVSTTTRHAVERLERDFHRAQRILVPNLSDWTQTGKVLAQLAAQYDYEQIGRGRLTNDALIAMSAGRLGITVITANARDFRKLAEFRSFQWRVNNPQTAGTPTLRLPDPQPRDNGPSVCKAHWRNKSLMTKVTNDPSPSGRSARRNSRNPARQSLQRPRGTGRPALLPRADPCVLDRI